MKIEEVIKLIESVSENNLTSFEYREGETVLHLEKKPKPVKTSACMQNAAGNVWQPVQMQNEDVKILEQDQYPAPNVEVHAGKGTQQIDSDHVVVSPLVGTFYLSSAPDAVPFVKAGDTVKKGQILGIIEAMKLMNEIESDYDGVVEAVLAGNEEAVEYGQPLFRIR